MKIMRILGLALILAGIVSIFAAVIGSQTNFFIAALVLGIAGNVLYWLGKPHFTNEGESEDSPHEGPSDKPPAS